MSVSPLWMSDLVALEDDKCSLDSRYQVALIIHEQLPFSVFQCFERSGEHLAPRHGMNFEK